MLSSFFICRDDLRHLEIGRHFTRLIDSTYRPRYRGPRKPHYRGVNNFPTCSNVSAPRTCETTISGLPLQGQKYLLSQLRICGDLGSQIILGGNPSGPAVIPRSSLVSPLHTLYQHLWQECKKVRGLPNWAKRFCRKTRQKTFIGGQRINLQSRTHTLGRDMPRSFTQVTQFPDMAFQRRSMFG
jgi:hypothetical protein